MARLFDISADFEELFNRFDEIQEMEFEKNEDGKFVDPEGNIIDPENYRADMLQAWFDTLEGIEEEFNFKAENTAQYIKSLKAEEAAIKSEEDKLKKRRQQYSRKIECMTVYLKNCMEQIGLKKIETPRARITIRNNAPSLKITDEVGFINMLQTNGRDDLLKYELPEIRKAEIKKLIKAGEIFPGAVLESSQSVIIG
jgi:hypothetical protein